MSSKDTQGDAGDNTLTGTGSNETFDGGKGSDTYVYAPGGGQDTIAALYDTTGGKVDTLQLNGIASADLQFSRSGNDLLIAFKGTASDGINVKSFFLNGDPGNSFNPLQRITFMDASGLSAQAPVGEFSIQAILATMTTGGSGDDTLSGSALADTLTGGAGNDTLTGDKGSDTYRFNKGDGRDLITATYDTTSGRTDTLALGAGLTRSDLSFASTGSSGTSLLIRFAGSTDEITVEKFLYGDSAVNGFSPLQAITFADDADAALKGSSTAAMTVADILAALYAGTTGADNQHGTSGNDSITGLAGDDLIDARDGNDTLVGGAGNDTLNGGTGNDRYDYARGDGSDLIKMQSDSNAGKNNVLHFAAGITTDDVTLTRSGTSLLIGIKASGTTPASTITVEGFSFTAGADNGYNPLQQIVFDGPQVTWNLAALQAAVATTASGGSSNTPTTGADRLTGTADADTLTGGTGNDTLDGGLGNDTYVYSAGDGQDTLLAARDTASGKSNTLQLNGIDAGNLRLSRSGSDLVIGFANKPGDSITAKLFFFNEDPYNDYNPLQKITFMSADGKTAQTPVAGYDLAALIEMMNTGGSGNDRVVGTSADDTLRGGLGNDTIIGGKGDDLIEFTLGDGKDLITTLAGEPWSGREDSLAVHGDGTTTVTADTLSFGTSGTSLVIKVGTGGDQITVDRFLLQDTPYNNYNPLQKVRFDDGSELDIADILQRLYGGTSGADSLRGTAGADTITGLAGNDTIEARDGDDRIEGGAGNDLIDGGKGDDSYWFGLGDGADTLLGTYDDASSKHNALVLKSGIVESDVALTRSGSDLVISLNATNSTRKESITVKNFSFALNTDSLYNPLQGITFDGVTTSTGAKVSWSLAEIQGKVAGSSSTQTQTGDDTAQVLKGTDGDDTIDGGRGDDTIDGGLGNDTYVFESGDGSDVLSLSRDTTVGRNDTLQLGYLKSSSTDASQVATFTRSGNDLIIGTPAATDKVTVKGFFMFNDPRNAYNPLQFIAFQDATKDIDWIVRQANIGTAGNDKLMGTTGADTLIGGKGSDTLIGGAGDDIYQFSIGDGQDTITAEVSDTTIGRKDTLNFLGTGLSADQLVLQTSGAALVIGLSSSPTDQVTVEQFLYNDTPSNKYNPLQAITFNGGGEILISEILSRLYGGTAKADNLRGTVDADVITGGYGNDVLDGRAGNDTITGGPGNDTITGGTGDNLYIFAKGDGQDTLMPTRDTTPGRNSTLELTDCTVDDLVLNKLNGSLVIQFNKVDKTNTDKITVGAFDFTGGGNDYSALQTIYIKSSDTRWDTTAILEHLAGGTWTGTSGSERLTGDIGPDTITGLGGDDTLKGMDGNDELTGGLGDDLIDGGVGNDTYVFNKGDGHDTIASGGATTGEVNTLKFGSDVSSGDLQFTRSGSSLLIYLNKVTTTNTDMITVEDFSFSATDDNPLNPLQQITVGGATWDLATIRGQVGGLTLTGDTGANTIKGGDLNDTISGGAGNDTLYGYAGNDSLTGGEGTDVLNGGDGNDTYVWNAGDASNVIVDSGGADTLVMDFPYLFLFFQQSGNDLLINMYVSDTLQTITIDDWYVGDSHKVETISGKFLATKELTAAQVNTLASAMAGLATPTSFQDYVYSNVYEAVRNTALNLWH